MSSTKTSNNFFALSTFVSTTTGEGFMQGQEISYVKVSSLPQVDRLKFLQLPDANFDPRFPFQVQDPVDITSQAAYYVALTSYKASQFPV